MNADDLLPAGVALALALLTSHLLRRRSAHPRPASRYQTIDGLRGYLAFGVFLHHAAIWQMYRQGGQWMLAAPASHGYLNFGRASVALFFMITAFLFCRRVLEARSQPIDWLHLYVSRLMRLAPVYGLAMLLLFIVVGVETRWTLAVPAAELGQQVLDWLLFGFAGMPDINGLHGTALVLASVVWSLAYEWLFYLALPMFAWLIGTAPPLWVLGAPVLALVAVAVTISTLEFKYVLAFAPGMAAAVLVASPALKRFAPSPWASLLVLACLTWQFVEYSDAFATRSIAALGLAFILIAAGTSLFGLLTTRLSTDFGEPTYSVYLLHGALLFICFKYVLGTSFAASLSTTQHWLIVWALAPILVAISIATNRAIEQPMMAAAGPVTARIRSRTRELASLWFGRRRR